MTTQLERLAEHRPVGRPSTNHPWPGEPTVCRCKRMVVERLEETLDCPKDWGYVPGIGWVHG